MKKITSTPVKALALMTLILFAVQWAVWFFCYPYFLRWLEGFSFFSTLPDFAASHKDMPYGFKAFIGSFLHQFYAMPAVGAAIQAFMGTWSVICTGTALICFFNNPRGALWMSLIPLPFFIFIQFWDLNMLNSMLWFLVFTAALVVVFAVSLIVRRKLTMPKLFCLKPLNAIATVLVSVVAVYMLVFMDPRNKVHEEQVRLQHLGEKHQWEEILNTVSIADAKPDDLKKRYVLLALSEMGILTDHAFRYGLSHSDDFIFYESINPLCINYNALFYQCLGMHNAAIHQLYQQGIQSPLGVSFSTLRRLADIYIAVKDYELASKYVDILSHTTCHRKWVKERLPQLEAIRNAEPEYGKESRAATISNFTHTISSIVDRNRESHKYADLLLCAFLADEEGDKFRNLIRYVAQVQYPSGKGLPRLYEEALVLIAMTEPSVLEGFTVSEDTMNRFNDYVGMMNSGKGTQALKKHAATYWVYSYR